MAPVVAMDTYIVDGMLTNQGAPDDGGGGSLNIFCWWYLALSGLWVCYGNDILTS